MGRLPIVSAAMAATALLVAGCGGADDRTARDDAAQTKQQRVHQKLRAARPYATTVTIGQDRSPPNTFIHGKVDSAVRKCEVGRRVAVFKQEPGADRLLATVPSNHEGGSYGVWGRYFRQAKAGWRVYARVRRAEHSHGLVCLREGSAIYTVRG